MWKRTIAWGILLLLFSSEAYAARCKVDGKWYDYDSPQCNPNKTVDPDNKTDPIDPVQDVASNRQTDTEAPVISPITGPALMTSYLRPWSEVVYLVEERCKDRATPLDHMDCIIREENGYWAMHGNFEMPERIVAESKAICATATKSFRNQVLCMHNESMGYKKFTTDSEMPDAMASAARNECQETFRSWSQRGSCMFSANLRYKHPNGLSKRRTMAVSGYGYIQPPLGYAKESEVVTFRARPRKDRELQQIGEPPPTPEPMTVQQRAARLAPDAADPGVLADAIEILEAEGEFNVLSAAVPQIEGIGSIGFSWPTTVATKYGVRLTEEDNSSLGMSIEIESGRVYLVDFVVMAYQPGSYIVTNGSNTHVFEDLGPAIRNVTVRLIPEYTGTTGFTLKRQHGKGFNFYAVGITSVEATGPFTPEIVTTGDGNLPEQIDGS